MKRLIRLTSLFIITLFLALSPYPEQPTAYAHGGVIIDGGFTDAYEWIAMASPFPVTPGETILTVLLYDIETYAPIDGLVPKLELAPPSAPRPCCSGDDTLGPMSLLVDPTLYPGDYSNITLLLQEGTWEGKFTINEDDPVGPGELVEIFFEVDVKEAAEDEERPTPIGAEFIALTATAVANGGYPAPADSAANPEANPEANSDGAVGTDENETEPYPGPQVEGQNSPSEATPVQESEEPVPVAGVDASPDEQLQDNREAAGEANSGSLSWASENIWLLAALALVPILLIVAWLAVSNNSEANEWSGDEEE